jgi:hypothetical protein
MFYLMCPLYLRLYSLQMCFLNYNIIFGSLFKYWVSDTTGFTFVLSEGDGDSITSFLVQ